MRSSARRESSLSSFSAFFFFFVPKTLDFGFFFFCSSWDAPLIRVSRSLHLFLDGHAHNSVATAREFFLFGSCSIFSGHKILNV
jgi:hypothetical protein